MARAEQSVPWKNVDRYKIASCDLKWAILAVASARQAFLSSAYINRLEQIENDLIAFRNELEGEY